MKFSTYISLSEICNFFFRITSTASFLGLNYLCIELQGDVQLNLLLSAVTEVLGWAIAALILRCISRRCSYCVTCALGGVLCVTMAARRRGTCTLCET